MRQRLKRAWRYLKEKQIRESFKALFDKGYTELSAGVEYGYLSFKKINQVIQNNAQWADPTLLGLAQRADKSRYEKHFQGISGDMITKEQYELILHIFQTYDRLHKKLLSK